MQIRAKAVLVDAKGKPIINPKTKAPRVFSEWLPMQDDQAAQCNASNSLWSERH